MYKKLLLSFCLMMMAHLSMGQLQEWAAGFRIGEPGGFMARKYSENGINALEVNIGTYGGLWGTDRNYRDGEFRNIGYSINVLYLWHYPTILNADLHTYNGFGPQINSRDLYNKGKSTSTRNQGMGGAAVGGLEYFPIDAPSLSFFGEVGFYTEIAPNPFFSHIQGGIGVRVNF
jgi:hypothetical protein